MNCQALDDKWEQDFLDCFHACIATHLKMFWVKPFPLFSMAVSEARGWPNLTESCGFLCGDRVIPGSWGKKAHSVSQARSSKKMVDSNKIRSKTLIFLLVWDPAVNFFLIAAYLSISLESKTIFTWMSSTRIRSVEHPWIFPGCQASPMKLNLSSLHSGVHMNATQKWHKIGKILTSLWVETGASLTDSIEHKFDFSLDAHLSRHANVPCPTTSTCIQYISSCNIIELYHRIISRPNDSK